MTSVSRWLPPAILRVWAWSCAASGLHMQTPACTFCACGDCRTRSWRAVSLHHQPSGSSASSPAPLTMVHAADVLTREEENWPRSNFDMEYLSRVGLHSRIAHWRTLSRRTE